MAISKERKTKLVGEYQQLLEGSQGLILTSYSGLTMKELESLRRRLREIGGEFHIVKNTLLDLAAREVGLTLPPEVLRGTTAVGFAQEEVPAVVKAIVELGRESETLHLKAGVIGGEYFSAAQMEQLADLPPLPVLRARLLGVLAAPAGRVAGTLAGSVRQLASVLKARSESTAVATAP